MPAATHKAILEKANAAIEKGDYDGFLAHCTEDTEWTFVGDRTLSGKRAVREWMATAYTEPPKFDVHHLIAEGDIVTARGRDHVEGRSRQGNAPCVLRCVAIS